MSKANVIQLIQAGLAHHQAAHLDKAAALYRQVLVIDPQQWDALHLLGLIAHQQGRHAEAVNMIAHAVKIRPQEAGFWFNYGNVLAAAGRDADAVKAYRTATDLVPTFMQAWFNLFSALERMNQWDDLAVTAEAITNLQPNNPDHQLRFGKALYMVGHLGKAATVFRNAIKLRPGFEEAQHELALALAGLGQISDAIDLLQELLAKWPAAKAREIHDHLLLTLQYSDQKSPAEIFEQHQKWGLTYADPLTPPKVKCPSTTLDEPRRLRIGYLSSDFRIHPVGWFVLPILTHHDRQRFEIFCYEASDLGDLLTDTLKQRAEHWRSVFRLSDDALAQQIRGDRIDLMIDLNGHTGGNRLLMLARRPAPVAATYLGYPGTTGTSAIDFRITDAFADPPGMSEPLHTERLIRLPRCFLCFAPVAGSPDVAPLPARSSDHVTFGSFNQSGKISPATVQLWSDVLRAVPKSRLVLKANGLMDPQTRERLFSEFKEKGIDRGRIEMLPIEGQHRDHLAKYARVDIALDTYPYHGTTTTCDALWMGVPTLTLAGKSHVSRVGVSLMTHAGFPEWVANSRDSLISKAAAFAADIAALDELRRSLRNRLQSSPLMDAPGFVQELEAAFIAIVAAGK